MQADAGQCSWLICFDLIQRYVNSQCEWPSVGTMETSRPPSLLGTGVQLRQLMIRSVSSVLLVKRSSWLLNIK